MKDWKNLLLFQPNLQQKSLQAQKRQKPLQSQSPPKAPMEKKCDPATENLW